MNLPKPWSGPFSRESTKALTGLPLANPLINRFREKRWCYAGMVSPDLFFGAAVVHLGYITSAFAFGFDRQSGKMVEATLTLPPLGHCRYDRNPEAGTCEFKGSGSRIKIENRPGSFTKQISIDLDKKDGAIQAALELFAPDRHFSPMHFPMDMGGGKNAFTTKAAGLGAKGEIRLNRKTYPLDPGAAFGLFDWTHGAYHRETFWNWACGAGQAESPDGESLTLGFNFSRGVYENGRLENTLWLNGRPEPVSALTWEYDAGSPLTTWQIVSEDRRIDLTFHPEGMRSADDNFVLVKSRFLQPCGRFEGRITTAAGQDLILKSVSGVVEEHFAKW